LTLAGESETVGDVRKRLQNNMENTDLPKRPKPEHVQRALDFARRRGSGGWGAAKFDAGVLASEIMHLQDEVLAYRELFKDLYNAACFDYDTMPEAGRRAFQSVVIEWCGKALDKR
jgi:hypothetical protein